MLESLLRETDWLDALRRTDEPVLLYGMGSGADKILETLQDPHIRPKLMQDLIHRYGFFFPKGTTGKIYWTKDRYDDARGRTLDEIAAQRNETVYETVLHLLIENDLEIGFNGVEYQSPELKEKLYDDQYHLFLQDRYTVGSDSIPTGGLSHCRTSGAFSRIIAQMRARGEAPLDRCVRRVVAAHDVYGNPHAPSLLRTPAGRPAGRWANKWKKTLTRGMKVSVQKGSGRREKARAHAFFFSFASISMTSLPS